MGLKREEKTKSRARVVDCTGANDDNIHEMELEFLTEYLVGEVYKQDTQPLVGCVNEAAQALMQVVFNRAKYANERDNPWMGVSIINVLQKNYDYTFVSMNKGNQLHADYVLMQLANNPMRNQYRRFVEAHYAQCEAEADAHGDLYFYRTDEAHSVRAFLHQTKVIGNLAFYTI